MKGLKIFEEKSMHDEIDDDDEKLILGYRKFNFF